MKSKTIKSILLCVAMLCILCFPVQVMAETQQGTTGDELQLMEAEKLEIQLGKRCVLPADLFALFHEEVVAYLITHVVQGLWSAGMVQHLAQIEHLRRAVRFPVRLDEMVQQVVLYLHLFGEGEQHQQWPVLFA